MNYPWQATVQDDQGNAVVNPVVTVWEADGVTLATIYDVTGAEIANPITGSLEGFVQFWAAEGEYRIEGAGGGEETEVWSWVAGPVASVRYDAAQSLTGPEKTQALSNIGAQPVGSYQPSGGYVRYDEGQSLTSSEEAQARANLGVGTLGVLNTNGNADNILKGDGNWEDLRTLLASMLAYNAIGSFVFASQSLMIRAPDEVIAGSNLSPAGVGGQSGSDATFRMLPSWPKPTGTWRALGYSEGIGGSQEGATLWQRVS